VGVRAGPPVPELSLSEDFVLSAATAFRIEVNKALAIARDVSLGKDFKLFLLVSCPTCEELHPEFELLTDCWSFDELWCRVQVIVSLYVVSTVTSWFNLLTCIWIGKLAVSLIMYKRFPFGKLSTRLT
jgi:hypothetical protein